MIALNSSIDRVFDDMFNTLSQIPYTPSNGLSYQVRESADKTSVILEVEVPGVNPDEVKVEAKGRAVVVECPKGSTYVTVGSRLDLEGITASIKWGMLHVHIPRRDSKSVEIAVTKEE
jgi:HSP20 family molecular chaperone IbpA